MVRESIEARAGTPNIVGARGDPSVFAGDVHELILVEGCKRDVAWTALSLFFWGSLFGCILLLEMSSHKIAVFESRLRIWA